MTKSVTREQAEAVVEALKVQFAAYIPSGAPQDYLPQLKDAGDWLGEDVKGQYVVLWSEGAPFFGWARHAFRSTTDWDKYDALMKPGLLDSETAEDQATIPAHPLPKDVWVEAVDDAVLRIMRK